MSKTPIEEAIEEKALDTEEVNRLPFLDRGASGNSMFFDAKSPTGPEHRPRKGRDRTLEKILGELCYGFVQWVGDTAFADEDSFCEAWEAFVVQRIRTYVADLSDDEVRALADMHEDIFKNVAILEGISKTPMEALRSYCEAALSSLMIRKIEWPGHYIFGGEDYEGVLRTRYKLSKSKIVAVGSSMLKGQPYSITHIPNGRWI